MDAGKYALPRASYLTYFGARNLVLEGPTEQHSAHARSEQEGPEKARIGKHTRARTKKHRTHARQSTHLKVDGSERCVSGHEEVQARCGDEGGDDADQVVVHVARVSQGGRARAHHGRDLCGARMA